MPKARKSPRDLLSPHVRGELDAKGAEYARLAGEHRLILQRLRSTCQDVAQELRQGVAEMICKEKFYAALALRAKAADLNLELRKLEVACRMLLLGVGGA